MDLSMLHIICLGQSCVNNFQFLAEDSILLSFSVSSLLTPYVRASTWLQLDLVLCSCITSSSIHNSTADTVIRL